MHSKQFWYAFKLGMLWRGTSRFRLPPTCMIKGQRFHVHSTGEGSQDVVFRDVLINDDYGINLLPNRPKTIVDIGANAGFFTMWAGGSFPEAIIHCYEPSAKLQPILSSNAAQVGAIVYCEGVSSKNGLGSFREFGDSLIGRCVPSEFGDVPVVSLKNVIERIGGWVDLLKIDCEGAEWDILEDPQALHSVGAIRMEYHFLNETHTFERLCRLLEANGFFLSRHYPNQGYGIAWFDRSDAGRDRCNSNNAFAIFGERCSGTNIIEAAIALNSPLKPTWEFGFKHFPKALEELDHRLLGQTPVIVVVRHPTEWLRSLYSQPWHAAQEVRDRPFEEFVCSQWWSLWNEEALLENHHPNFGMEIMEDRDVETRLRFSNPLKMRKQKYARFLQTGALGSKLILVRLEDYIADPRACIASILRDLECAVPKKIQVPIGYKGVQSRKRKILNFMGLGWLEFNFRKRKKPFVSPETINLISQLVDKDQEALFGYKIFEEKAEKLPLLKEKAADGR